MIRRTAAAVLSVAVVATLLVFTPAQPAGAATLGAALSIVSDGTPGWDASPGPGFDTGPNNGIVRTRDRVTYKMDYSVNAGAGTNVTLESTLEEGATWMDLPPQCTGPGSGRFNNNRTLVCNVGDVPSGTTGSLNAIVVFDTTMPNGYVSPISFTVSEDTSMTVASNVAFVEISARASVDLFHRFRQQTFGELNGEEGFFTATEILVWHSNPSTFGQTPVGRGHRAMYGPKTFDYQVQNPTPNTVIIACSTDVNIGDRPHPNDYADNGTATCPTGASGTTITLTDVNWELRNPPTTTSQGQPFQFAAFTHVVVTTFTPTQDVLDAGGSVAMSFDATGWDPVDADGQSNYGGVGEACDTTPVDAPSCEALNNNRVNRTLQYGSDGNTNLAIFATPDFGIPVSATTAPPLLPWQSGTGTGDGAVVPGQTFWSRMSMSVTGAVPYEDFGFCIAWDDPNIEYSPSADPIMYMRDETFVTQNVTADWTIEYGNGAVDDGCADSASTDGWNTDPALLPGGRASVTKVRAFAPSPMEAPDAWTFNVPTIAATPDDPDNEFGTYMGTHGFLTDSQLAGAWIPVPHPYDEDVHVPRVLGDRVQLIEAHTYTQKSVIDPPQNPGDPAPRVAAGDRVDYHIDFRTFANGLPSGARDVVLVDTIPNGMTYVPGSASVAPDSIVNNPDGSTTLTWILGDVPADTTFLPRFEVIYSADVNIDAPADAILENVVVAETPSDLRPESLRDDNAVVVASQSNVLAVSKQPLQEIVSKNEAIGWNTNVANVGPQDMPYLDMIDILPYNGDGRGTDFNGTLELASATGPARTLVLYTATDPADINPDPHDLSNAQGMSTPWCEPTETDPFWPNFGDVGCPTTLADVTGVRFYSDGDSGDPFLPQGAPPVTFTITMSTNGNQGDDIYVNDTVARTHSAVLALPIEAEANPVVVFNGAVGDLLFDDRNGDGIYNPAHGDVGIAGETIQVVDVNTGNVVGTTVTDGDGRWLIDNLDPGTYIIRVPDYFETNPHMAASPARVDVSPTANEDADHNAHQNGSHLESSQFTLTPGTAPINDDPAGIKPGNLLDSNTNQTLDLAVRASQGTTIGPIPDTLTLVQGTSSTFDVRTNDPAPWNGSDVFVRAINPKYGSLTCTEPGLCTYTALPEYVGVDTGAYRICLGGHDGTCREVALTFTVTEAPNLPTARDDRAVATTGSPAVFVSPTENDSDPNLNETFDRAELGETLTLTGQATLDNAPTGASVSCDPAADQCEITAPDGYTGTIVATYEMTDSTGNLTTASLIARFDPAPITKDTFTGEDHTTLTSKISDYDPTIPVATVMFCDATTPLPIHIQLDWTATGEGATLTSVWEIERQAAVNADPDNPDWGNWEHVAFVPFTNLSYIDDRVGEGNVYRYRINGSVERWKSQPGSPSLPVDLTGTEGGTVGCGTGLTPFAPDTRPAALSGVAWIDDNADGIRTVDETGRKDAMTVTVTDQATGTLVASTVTDINGRYLVTGLTPGRYLVVFEGGSEIVTITDDVHPDVDDDNDFGDNNGEFPAITDVGYNGLLILDLGVLP